MTPESIASAPDSTPDLLYCCCTAPTCPPTHRPSEAVPPGDDEAAKKAAAATNEESTKLLKEALAALTAGDVKAAKGFVQKAEGWFTKARKSAEAMDAKKKAEEEEKAKKKAEEEGSSSSEGSKQQQQAGKVRRGLSRGLARTSSQCQCQFAYAVPLPGRSCQCNLGNALLAPHLTVGRLPAAVLTTSMNSCPLAPSQHQESSLFMCSCPLTLYAASHPPTLRHRPVLKPLHSFHPTTPSLPDTPTHCTLYLLLSAPNPGARAHPGPPVRHPARQHAVRVEPDAGGGRRRVAARVG